MHHFFGGSHYLGLGWVKIIITTREYGVVMLSVALAVCRSVMLNFFKAVTKKVYYFDIRYISSEHLGHVHKGYRNRVKVNVPGAN